MDRHDAPTVSFWSARVHLAVPAFREIEPCPGSFDIRHRFSPPSPNCAVACRDRKTDRVAITPASASCPGVAWRGITDAQGAIAAGKTRFFLSASQDVSEPKPALSAKTPIDAAARQHDAGDVTAKLLLERRTPGHELKAQAIIDHREPA